MQNIANSLMKKLISPCHYREALTQQGTYLERSATVVLASERQMPDSRNAPQSVPRNANNPQQNGYQQEMLRQKAQQPVAQGIGNANGT